MKPSDTAIPSEHSSSDHDPNQFACPKVTILGIILLMLGGPQFPMTQKRSTDVATPTSFNRYAVALALVSVLAGTLELSLL